MAIECSLARVKPNPVRSRRGTWDPEAIDMYVSLKKCPNIFLGSATSTALSSLASLFSGVK
jgi:hypothetical protein